MLCFLKGLYIPYSIYLYLYSHPIYPPSTFCLSCCCFVPSCIDFRSFSKHASTYHSTYVLHLFLFCSLHWGILFWKSTSFAMLFLCLTSWTGPRSKPWLEQPCVWGLFFLFTYFCFFYSITFDRKAVVTVAAYLCISTTWVCYGYIFCFISNKYFLSQGPWGFWDL